MRPFLFLGIWGRLGLLVGTAAVTGETMPAGAEQRFASGSARVALIELFTSEGCSSCPPAERWLGGLRTAPGLWKDFVPVAWHVDYWNRLGWPDRFSTKDYTQRQYAVAAAWGSGSVYTPCFVRDGEEWRARGAAPEINASGKQAGELTVVLGVEGGCRVEFAPSVMGAAKAEWVVHVAVLGGGFASKVTAGENRGETLRQEFVALAVSEHPLVTAASAAARTAEFALPKAKITDGERRAVAVWVTRRGELTPVQATGGWID
jgi:hypothetical protein